MKGTLQGRWDRFEPWAEYERKSREYREAYDREHREREAERRRLESLSPKYVVHTVHGTFAKRAKWIEADEKLCQHLRKELGWRVRVEPFRWSGRNSARDRSEAARELSRRLHCSLKKFPTAHQAIVAHSHGGNIALWALTDKVLARKILGVATLATPFLSARVRPARDIIGVGAILFAALFAFWAALFLGVYRGDGLRWWPWATGAGLTVLGALVLGAFAVEGMRKYAQRLAIWMPPTALTRDQVAVIRVQADEATPAIAGVRLAGILSDLIWRVLSAPVYLWISDWLRGIDYAGEYATRQKSLQEIQHRRPLWDSVLDRRPLRGGPPEQLPLFTSSVPNPPEFPNLLSSLDQWRGPTSRMSSAFAPGPNVIWQGILQALPMTAWYLIEQGSQIERSVALAVLLLYSLPAAFAIVTVLLGVPFAVLSSISLLLCGWTMPFAGPYLHVAAESCPPGTWTVRQLEGPLEPRGLFHSEAYQEPEAWEFIAEWIKDRARGAEQSTNQFKRP